MRVSMFEDEQVSVRRWVGEGAQVSRVGACSLLALERSSLSRSRLSGVPFLLALER